MIKRATAVMMCVAILAPAVTVGQSTDTASERARLGDQRARAEAEQRAREEAERQGRSSAPTTAPVAQRPLSTQPPPAPPPAQYAAPATPPAAPPATAGAAPRSTPPQPPPPLVEDQTSRALEQLRELGELKDAGYLTDDEFRRIKARILESRF